MCGGHGLHHLLDNIDSHAGSVESGDGHTPADAGRSAAGMQQQVRLMYARGEIDAGLFHRLLDMAQRGELSRDDLHGILSHAAAEPRIRQDQPEPAQPTPPGHVQHLHERQLQLESARAETEGSIRRLELEAARLRREAEATGFLAQGVEPETANAALETKQKALRQAQAVEQRAASIKASLARITAQLDEAIRQERMVIAAGIGR